MYLSDMNNVCFQLILMPLCYSSCTFLELLSCRLPLLRNHTLWLGFPVWKLMLQTSFALHPTSHTINILADVNVNNDSSKKYKRLLLKKKRKRKRGRLSQHPGREFRGAIGNKMDAEWEVWGENSKSFSTAVSSFFLLFFCGARAPLGISNVLQGPWK